MSYRVRTGARTAAAAVLLASALTGCGVRVGYYSDRPQQRSKPKPLPTHSVEKPTGLADGDLTGPVTGETANAMVAALWQSNEIARMAGDFDVTRSVLVEPELTNEVVRQGHMACCYHGTPPQALVLDDTAVVLGAGTAPTVMLGIVHAHFAVGARPVEIEMVLVRPADHWRVALLATSTAINPVRSSKLGGTPRTTKQEGVRILQMVGQNQQSWWKTGAPTKTAVWSGIADEYGMGERQMGLKAASSDFASTTVAYGSPAPAEVWIVKAPVGGDIICGLIPQVGTTKALHGKTLNQDDTRTNWGDFIAPGQYLSIVDHAAYSACVQSPDHGRHVKVLGLDWTTVASEGVQAH